MAGDFGARLDELAARVGEGDLTAACEVNQIYAHYQHEGLDLKHPRGGQARYLGEPLAERHRDYLGRLADAVLSEEGPAPAAARVAEDLSEQVARRAPVELGDLRRSGHPTVTDNGRVVYDRPPAVPRLTEEQLRDKARRRGRR